MVSRRLLEHAAVALAVVVFVFTVLAASRSAGQEPFRVGETVTASRFNQMLYRIGELERKVAGMQKQITILHAKKADK